MADASNVKAVREPDNGHAEFGRALDPSLHCLEAHYLTKTRIALQGQHAPGIAHDADVLVDLQPTRENRFDIARQHPDAVRIVTGEIRLDQLHRHQFGFPCARSGAGYDRLHQGHQRLRMDCDARDCFRHGTPLSWFEWFGTVYAVPA